MLELQNNSFRLVREGLGLILLLLAAAVCGVMEESSPACVGQRVWESEAL